MTDSLLIEAAKAGDIAAVQQRIERGDDINARYNGDNALHWAACRGYTDIVRLLVECGADLSITGSGGSTPQHLARGYPETLAVLEAAAQAPRALPGNPEKWVRAGGNAVAFVSVYPSLGKKITQLFNFETRQQIVLSENLVTKAEAMAGPASFDDLPARVLEKALEEFGKFGGKADRDFVLSGDEGLGKGLKMPTAGGGHG